MKRRTVILILALALVLGLAGCKGEPESSRPDMKALRAANVGSYVYFGEYEQDDDTSTGKEAIEWLVLAKEEDRMLMISRYALDCKPFNTEDGEAFWMKSSLQGWLNNGFYESAFTAEEKSVILDSPLEEETYWITSQGLRVILKGESFSMSYPTEPEASGAADASSDHDNIEEYYDTSRVFVLTHNEVVRYFDEDDARACQGTPYCYHQGAWKSENGNCRWWLNSFGRSTEQASYILDTGAIFSEGDVVGREDIAVRPAMWIKIGEGK